MLKKHRAAFVGLGLGLIVSLLVFLITSFFYLFQVFELRTLDYRFSFRGERAPPQNIVIIAIDEMSVKKLGRWPWPRSDHAQIIDYLSQGKPKQIFFDTFFLERDKEHPQSDQALISSTERAKCVYFDFPFEKEGRKIIPQNLEELIKKDSRHLNLFKGKKLIEERGISLPLDEIIKVAKGIGHANIYEDEDNIYRRASLVKFQNRIYPFSALLLAGGYLGVDWEEIGVPLDERGEMLINFLGGTKTFPYIPYYKVFNKSIPSKFFRDKIVLVGATATGIYDIRPTPFGSMPGVEVIANALNTILTKDFLLPVSEGINLIIILILGMTSGYLSSNFRLFLSSLFVFALLLAFLILATLLFEIKGVWLNLVQPGLSILLTYLSVITYRYSSEEKEKKKIKGAFQHYVTASVVNEILRDPEKLKLGGEKKRLTVLFSDIRGFTSLSERLSPEEVVKLLNEYFTEMTEIVFEHKGTLDKFIGDALMVIYGAPIFYPEHAQEAILTALAMREKLAELQARREKEGKAPFRIGVGINTGEMVEGNMGSSDRWDYTVVGDAVNLASRLESLNKEYKTDILISESTYELVKDLIEVRQCGQVKVKGKEKEVLVYEVIGRKAQ